ncbi:MAG: hypothetical protein LBP98_00055, partial [Tannerella sp.]|nr:hypothetical protein [Tannerella sp.]
MGKSAAKDVFISGNRGDLPQWMFSFPRRGEDCRKRCLTLEKVDSLKELRMYLHTKKQRQYFDKVIKLHCDYGYGG